MFPDPDSKLAQRLNPVLFLLPALTIYLIFAIYPTYSVLEYSFTDWDGISPERNFVGLENYQKLFSDKIFWAAFRNTFVWSGVIIVINVGFGLVIAAMLARVWKARLLIQTCIVLPVVISPMAVATIWRWMYQPTGVINQVLEKIGLGAFATPWLGSPDAVLYALAFAHSWSTIGLSVIIFLAGLQAVDEDLYEAARVDGANPLQSFRHVTLPALRPVTAVVFILGVIAVLMVSPLILTVFSSLKPTTELVNPPWYPPINLTFEHYVRVWTDGGFSRYFFNTLVISVVDAIVMIIIASLAAYAMVFMDFRGKMILQVLFLIGLMIPVTAIVLPLFQIVRTFGLLNTHLGVIFADLALAVSIFVFMFSSFFQGVPKALHEAARIDGATEFQIYRRVVMPIATPAVVTTALLEFLWSWNDLLLRLLLMTRDEMRTLSVGLLNFQGTMTRDVTGLSSGTVIMAIPVVLLFLFFQRHFVRGMTAGAVK